MLNSVISIVLLFVFMIVVPLLFGMAVTNLIGFEKNILNSYIVGLLSMMCICELVAVPSAFFRLSFLFVFVIYWIIIASLVLVGIVKDRGVIRSNFSNIKTRVRSYSLLEILLLAVMITMIGVIIVNSLRLHVVDEDDSRFVVTAADILRTDTLFLADPNTGFVYDNWSYGIDASKDIIAPHAVFCAILSRVTITKVVVFMHQCYPVFLYCLSVGLFYNLISELLKDNEHIAASKHKESYKFLFITVILIYTIFQYSTRNTREAMFLVRIWQGKAILAGIIIPAIIWILYRIYRTPDKPSYCLLFITSIAGCLVSSMATLLIPILLGCYGLIYGVSKKSLRVSLYIWVSAIVPILLSLLSLYIRNEMIL